MAKKTPGRKKTIRHADIVRGFAERLRELRRSRGLSQADLASRAGVHWTYVGRLERGKAAPGLDLMGRLAEALNAPVADLLPTKAANPVPFQQQQARTRLESILKRADNSTLGILNAVLAMMDDNLARGH